jgi:hypothetical protein
LGLFFIFHSLPKAARSERDSSGTTETPTRTSGAQGVKVMERIARRERAKGARSGSPKFNMLIC